MNVLFKEPHIEISYEECPVHTLVIENRALFSNVILSLEQDYTEDYFIFSENLKSFVPDVITAYIGNPVNPNIDNRKLLTKINAYIEKLSSEDCVEEVAKVRETLVKLAEKISEVMDYEVNFNFDIDIKAIIKLLDFKINKEDLTPAQVLVQYMLFVAKYLQNNFFIIQNLHLYFTEEEIGEIYKTLRLNQIKLLVLEGVAPKKKEEFEVLHIIDSDLCVINS